jgi:hypothetical protein
MRRRPIALMTEPDMMLAHNSTLEQDDIEMTDMEDPELCIEQQSLLYPHDESKNKPAKMLSSYRGRRRILVVLAIAVAMTLGVVVVWGPLSSSSVEEQEGTSSHRSINQSINQSIDHFVDFVRDCVYLNFGRCGTDRRNGLFFSLSAS